MRISDWSSDVCSSDLSDGAEIKRGADAPAIHDSPSRDDRRATSLHQQAGQRHCAKATVRRVWIEDAAMAARFPSLSHNRVDPCFRRGNRLVEVCSSRQQHATGVLERADPSGIGQPEVKADNGWRSIDQQRQHLVVLDEASVNRTKRCRGLRTVSVEQWRHCREPCLFAGVILLHWLMDEDRSEEHTSELQSLMRISYAVFCLTKKTNRNVAACTT